MLDDSGTGCSWGTLAFPRRRFAQTAIAVTRPASTAAPTMLPTMTPIGNAASLLSALVERSVDCGTGAADTVVSLCWLATVDFRVVGALNGVAVIVTATGQCLRVTNKSPADKVVGKRALLHILETQRARARARPVRLVRPDLEHLPQHDAERPHICRRARRSREAALGRHVRLAAERCERVLLVWRKDARRAEIDDDGVGVVEIARRQHDIVRLQVKVAYLAATAAMEQVNAARHLIGKAQHQRLAVLEQLFLLFEAVQQLAQVAAFEQLHHDRQRLCGTVQRPAQERRNAVDVGRRDERVHMVVVVVASERDLLDGHTLHFVSHVVRQHTFDDIAAAARAELLLCQFQERRMKQLACARIDRVDVHRRLVKRPFLNFVLTMTAAFLAAVTAGDLVAFEHHILLGVDPAANNNAAIRAAAQNGRSEILERLLCDARVDPAAALGWVVVYGHSEIAERLLRDERVNPAANGNHAIRVAAAKGHAAIVEHLMRDVRVDPAAKDHEAVRKAAECNHVVVVERLLRDERVDPAANNNEAIRVAAKLGHTEVVERLLQDARVDPAADNNGAIRWAAEDGHAETVERLLRDARVNPAANSNEAIRAAAKKGHATVIERLLQDERVDPAVNDNKPICVAAQFGHSKVVDRLLQDVRVDPAANRNEALGWAAKKGHLGVTECLLRDARVDPAASGNHAIRAAAGAGHLAIVDRLLQDPRVDPTARHNEAIYMAAENGHVKVIERLLRDERVDPAACGNLPIRIAVAKNHAKAVGLLLQDARVDSATDDNHAIRWAAENGHVEIVERLLADERVDPTARDSEAICAAAEKGRTKVVERLLQDERVDPTANDNYAVRAAIGAGTAYYPVVDRLLADARVLGTIGEDLFARVTCIGMVRLRFTAVCVGLQDLELPALVTLEILDALLPNNIRMAAKWDLIVAVKHWRGQQRTDTVPRISQHSEYTSDR